MRKTFTLTYRNTRNSDEEITRNFPERGLFLKTFVLPQKFNTECFCIPFLIMF